MFSKTSTKNSFTAETSPAAIPAQPRSPLQIWRQSLTIYRHNWPEFTAIAGVGYTLMVLLAAVLGGGVLLLAPSSPWLASLLLAVAVMGGVVGVGLIHSMVLAAIAHRLAVVQAGRPLVLSQTFRYVASLTKNLLVAVLVLTTVAIGVIIMAGIPIFGWLLAPGVLACVGVVGSLAPAIVVVERQPGAWAVAQAWRLARLRFWPSVLAVGGPAVVGALIFVLPTMLMLALRLPLQLADIWLPLLLGLFFTPIFATVAALTYADGCGRSEGLVEANVPPIPTPTPQAGLVSRTELGKLTLLSLVVVTGVGLLAVGGYGVALVAPARLGERAAQKAIGSPAPAFSLTSPDGVPVTLDQLKGKPTVINFWATWCPPCKAELPLLQRTFGQNQQVNFLAISVKEEKETVRAFLQAESLQLPVALDSDGTVLEAFQVRGLPTTIFLNADGVIVGRHLGGLTETSLQEYLDTLLKNR